MDEQMIKYNKFGWVDLSELARNKNGTIDWRSSIGRKIHFKYQDIESDIVLLERISIESLKARVVGYVEECIINPHNVINGHFGKILNKKYYGFKYKPGDVVNDHLLLTSTYMNSGNKYYTYTCLIDGYNGHIAENKIEIGRGCPVCYGNVIKIGVNDISTVRPDMVSLFWNPDDAYIYGPYSNKRADFRCPRCGNKINAMVARVSKYGLSCKKCGDGISYPEKFIFNVLQQVAILHKEDVQLQDFKTQKTFDWSKNIQHLNPRLSGDKRYDFYIPLINKVLIETHGEQHFEEPSLHTHKNSKTLEEERENDQLKMNLSISNGVLPQNYIQLDCRYSDMNYIKNSIMFSNLPLLLNFTENDIDWDECNKFSTNSRIFEACELWNNGLHVRKDIADKMKLNQKTISRYLSRGLELGILQDPPKYLLNGNYQCIYEVCNLWNDGNHMIKDIASIMKMDRHTITKYLRRAEELGILKDPPKRLSKS